MADPPKMNMDLKCRWLESAAQLSVGWKRVSSHHCLWRRGPQSLVKEWYREGGAPADGSLTGRMLRPRRPHPCGHGAPTPAARPVVSSDTSIHMSQHIHTHRRAFTSMAQRELA